MHLDNVLKELVPHFQSLTYGYEEPFRGWVPDRWALHMKIEDKGEYFVYDDMPEMAIERAYDIMVRALTSEDSVTDANLHTASK